MPNTNKRVCETGLPLTFIFEPRDLDISNTAKPKFAMMVRPKRTILLLLPDCTILPKLFFFALPESVVDIEIGFFVKLLAKSWQIVCETTWLLLPHSLHLMFIKSLNRKKTIIHKTYIIPTRKSNVIFLIFIFLSPFSISNEQNFFT